MTYTPTQLEVIKTFGRKELSFGCLYEHNGSIYRLDSSNYKLKLEGTRYYLYIDCLCNCPREISKIYNEYKNEGEVKIIGSIPHLEDVFKMSENRMMNVSISNYDNNKLLVIRHINGNGNEIFIHIPYNPTIPLLEQPESVLIELLTIFK